MTLFQMIRTLVNSDQYLIGLHASERLEQRGVHEWQIIAAMPDCELLQERSQNLPNPVVEVECLLPDGTPVVVVWAFLPQSQCAKLVTVFFPKVDEQ
jgi:hypothetical protein